MKEANEFATALPGGELSVEEQDEVIGMLENLKERKRYVIVGVHTTHMLRALLYKASTGGFCRKSWRHLVRCSSPQHEDGGRLDRVHACLIHRGAFGHSWIVKWTRGFNIAIESGHPLLTSLVGCNVSPHQSGWRLHTFQRSLARTLTIPPLPWSEGCPRSSLYPLAALYSAGFGKHAPRHSIPLSRWAALSSLLCHFVICWGRKRNVDHSVRW